MGVVGCFFLEFGSEIHVTPRMNSYNFVITLIAKMHLYIFIRLTSVLSSPLLILCSLLKVHYVCMYLMGRVLYNTDNDFIS